MTEARLTTSWDDGHPLDMRLADLLARHGIAATFYVPVNNSEGRPVLEAAALRRLADAGFEIGAHTHDHVRLNQAPPARVEDQIRRGKDRLEQILGRTVGGFCYPGGRGVARARPVLRRLGFTHARTVEMLRLDRGADALALPTTLQIAPNSPAKLLRNWARQGGGTARLRMAWGCVAHGDLDHQIAWLIAQAQARGGILHLWGHSWEIDDLGWWPRLDHLLAALSARFPAPARIVNAALAPPPATP